MYLRSKITIYFLLHPGKKEWHFLQWNIGYLYFFLCYGEKFELNLVHFSPIRVKNYVIHFGRIICVFLHFFRISLIKNPTNQLFWLNFQCNVTTYTKVDEQKMEGGFQVLYKFRLLRLVQKKVQPHFFKMIRNFCVFLAFFALINQFLRQDIY